ncbi:MAG TPA: WYL domain-containing protein [Gemmatimonadota bacterium]|nr:WYL domain-containing protein [Gemmatimonadota bacterium]
MAAEVAADRLDRILYALPRALREGGVRLADLAAELGVDESRVMDDIAVVTGRAYTHPAGWVNDLEMYVDGGRVEAWTSGEFDRPVRLSPREALALALALRLLSAGMDAVRRDTLRELAGRLDAALTAFPAEPLTAGIALDGGDPDGNGALAVLRDAIAEKRRCRIRYLKAGRPEPETRLVAPYALALASGRWYVVGHSAEPDAVRVFRLDRMLEIESTGAPYSIPDDFDPRDYLEDGIVFHPGEEREAIVRYSPRIARWIAEREPVEELPDGSAVVRRAVADPGWIVRHVLSYGPDAELLEPDDLREAVREKIREMTRDQR